MTHAIHRPPLFSASLVLLLVAGCGLFDRTSTTPEPAGEAPGAGAGNSGSDVWSRSSYRGGGDPLDAMGFEAALHGQVSVPPDRALVRVRARASGVDRLGASTTAEELGAALVSEIAEEDICGAHMVDRSVVRFNGRQDWQSSVTLRVDALLTGLADVNARAARLEHCLARIDAAANSRDEGVVRMGAPLLTVDHPEAHRAELLARAFRDLSATGAIEGAPAQFHAAATRCTSGGHVTLQDRNLERVVLRVDLTCQPSFTTPTSAPERGPSEEGDVQ